MKKTELSLKKIDLTILLTGTIITLFCWLYISIIYTNLPNKIPSHFNGKGMIDDYSEKYFLWMILLVFTVLQLAVYSIAKRTHLHNFQLKNKLSNFRAIAIFIPYLAILLCIILFTIIKTSKNNLESSNFIIPYIIALTLITLVSLFTIILKNSKS